MDLQLLTAATMPAPGGALCAYLVLFGLAAVVAERALPAAWPNRRRCAAGGLLAIAVLAAAALAATWAGVRSTAGSPVVPAGPEGYR